MMKHRLLTLLLLTLASSVSAQTAREKALAAYQANAEACMHFLGEPNERSAAEMRTMNRNTRKYCKRASRQHQQLQARYKHDAQVQAVLATAEKELLWFKHH